MSKRNFTAFLITAFVLLSFTCVVADEQPSEAWTQKIDQALKQAKEEKKDLLLNFTGSDWCVWCIRLEKEVFSQVEFLEEAQKHFVLVKLDFPNDKSKIPEDVAQQNDEWKAKFGVSGFPTVYLVDASGRPYAKTGYKEGGPKAYLPHLKEKREVSTKLADLLGRAEKAEGLEKAKLLDEALALLDDDLVETHYGEIVKEIVALDSKNEAGLRAKYNAERDAEERREVLARIDLAKRSSSPKLALEVIDNALKNYQFPIETKLEVLQTKLKLLDAADRQVESVALLDELIADQRLAPEVRDDLQVQMIYSLVEAGDEESALRRLDALAAENKKRRHELFFSKGELLDRLGRHAAALEAYDQAITFSSDYEFRYEVRMAKSDSLASLDQVDDAIALLDSIISNKETPRYVISDTLIQKSMILRDAGRDNDAETVEKKAIELAESPEEKTELRKLIDQLRRLSK